MMLMLNIFSGLRILGWYWRRSQGDPCSPDKPLVRTIEDVRQEAEEVSFEEDGGTPFPEPYS